jgi:outer membrane protein assembly factor BamB
MKAIFVCIFLIFCFGCCSILYAQETTPYIFSNVPKHDKIEYLKLEKLYSIPFDDESGKNLYFISYFSNMDTDIDTNLYILDEKNFNLVVFNKKGQFIRTIGSKGQGPSEFESPDWLYIDNKDRIYVLERDKGIKIIDRNGKYLNFYVIQNNHYNITPFRIYNDCLYTLEIIIKGSTSVVLNMNKISIDFKTCNTFASLDIKLKSGKLSIPSPVNYVAWNIDSNGNVYLAQESNNTYKIDVFNNAGKLLYSFGRKYKNIPFTDKYLEHMKKTYEDRINVLKYPGIINYFFIDEDKVFVVVGECTGNLNNPLPKFKIMSTIDVFTTKGEYLYSFKDLYFSFNSLLKNGRLYSAPSQDDLNFHVFKIQYKK